MWRCSIKGSEQLVEQTVEVRSADTTTMADVQTSVPLHNGYKMPLIGLGSSREQGDSIKTALNTALEAGYRHIDTAYAYGNEVAIGEALNKWLSSGKLARDQLFVVTKLPRGGNKAELVEQYLKKSLESLQLSYVDLYLVHGPIGTLGPDTDKPKDKTVDPNTDHVSIWKAMEAQVDAGRARSIGLSNFNARQVKRIVEAARIPPVNLQVELNIYFQQRELVAFCKALDVTVCAYSPLGSPGASFRKEGSTPLNDPVVQSVAKKHGKTAGQVLLRHTVQRGISAIPKSTNPDRIKQNIQVFDFSLDEEDMDKLNALDKGDKGRMFRENHMKGSESHPEYPFKDRY